MTLATVMLLLLLTGATCYLLLGGADFGAGLWHLAARWSRHRRAEQEVIEHAMGPVWETNHVWLIFILVVAWTSFPLAFAAVSEAYWVPLGIAALGIIARGAAFAFRKAADDPRSAYALVFAVSSVVTPYCLGAVAGGIAAQRATGADLANWWNPTSVYAGLLLVGACAYLAAVYLTADARRSHGPELAAVFRRRALVTGVVVGALALAGPGVVRADAPALYAALTGRGGWLIATSATCGALSLVLLWLRRYALVRIAAALTVATLLWGSAVATYPHLGHPDLTVATAGANPIVLAAVLVALGLGALILVPSLAWLYRLFQGSAAGHEQA
ncbi:cytochrome D ubiquinol oxidase subunit II [Carbonactinospora thermoautotrophica]|uniref:Cytochrome D ubiquinol oxidase subunit II n=2 Tax=Carbonactinospora thermoautotrophica TaxID=1469144 RepID=A0A132N3H7_9ACTN|nr:cytochrome d ubiquinol oxidase subunit II [Carbonactinospora thermoautotrophica]KWX04142.1 cytochrome D ubiquinol oxidase subunit II [Carbonactinospora thermoautotrophica]